MFDMPTILTMNAQKVEHDLEQLSARLQGMADPVQGLWDAEICPEHLLPYLAWAFSVEVWDTKWPEAYRRQVLVDAVLVHRRKGTVGSVRRSLRGIGFRTDISEWFQHGGGPHTFRIDAFGNDIFASGFQIDAALFSLVRILLINVKPERSHFDLRIGESFNLTTTAKAGLRQSRRQTTDLSPRPRGHEIESNLGLAFGMRSRARHVQALAPRPRSHKLGAHLTIKAGLRLHQKHRATLTISPRGGSLYAT